MEYQQNIEAVFREDQSLPYTILYDKGNTKVYRIDTPNPIIIRVAEGDTSSHQFQAALLEELAAQDELTARILYWEIREIGDKPYGIQVQTYIPGKPLGHYPNKEQSKAIVGAIYNLHKRLCIASSRLGISSIPDIHKTVQQLYSLVDNCPIKAAATKLLEQKRYLELISQTEQCIIHGDLWYKNIHIEQTQNEIDVRLVDIDPLILGPKILQPAILFSSYFLLTALTIDPNAQEIFDLDGLLSYWPEPLNKKDVLLMMQLFPVGVGLLKEIRFSQDPHTNPEIHRSAMEPLERSIQIICEISGMT